MICWLNGQLIPVSGAAVPVCDRGFLLGDGIYETIRVYNGEAQWLERHLARLTYGLRVIALRHDANLPAAIAETIAANALDAGSLRITITRGSGPRGIAPPQKSEATTLITAFPAAGPLPPARIIIASRTRRNAFSPVAGIKSINCLDNIIARQEAARTGADDALLLDTRERISEATAGNVFAVINGELLTPLPGDGALPGITRARVLEIEGREATLTADDIRQASEIFLTSSLGIRPVAALDGTPLPAAHPVSDRLAEALFGQYPLAEPRGDDGGLHFI
ncbi:aminotransferase class IV [Pseudochelatococcus contaminans]|uniref:Probable branched-chain-amino-acid aminotransferase n=1 Tax=Pseudochelatococcus contaminans TaxID=1538103 RepID=A0A7W5Z1G9_9HYPH|nr:aminotransferase class IV [Pseudochelatococcus contaminans]MBB3808301.1 branched-chain amino acid aminotransferase [Pseudochelatococcus contaminans]